jgi:hypothetical protein
MCNCGLESRRVCPATCSFSVYLDAQRNAAPVVWKSSKRVSICLSCGEIVGRVPQSELQLLAGASGEDHERDEFYVELR